MTAWQKLFDVTIEHIRALGRDATSPASAAHANRVADRMQSRSCGDCSFCCYAKTIFKLDPPKPAWTRCEFQCASGCSRYSTRPEECANYLCAWRLGLGGESSRPDRTGVMVELENLTETVGATEAGAVIGIVVHAEGPYHSIPIRRMLWDARKLGIVHTAFTEPLHCRFEASQRYEHRGKEILRALSRHAGVGRVPDGWNRIIGPEVIPPNERISDEKNS